MFKNAKEIELHNGLNYFKNVNSILAMKIHISSETNTALKTFDCFETVERGQVEMKVGCVR